MTVLFDAQADTYGIVDERERERERESARWREREGKEGENVCTEETDTYA